MTPSLHILTLALRPAGVTRVVASVGAAQSPWPVRHVIAWHHGPPDPTFTANAATINRVLAMLPADDWIVFVDDDNLLHPNLPAALAECVSETRADAVMMGMHYRPGEYFSATPANLVPCSCDGGQLAARIGFARAVPWSAGPTGDGIYLQSLYAHNPDRWVFLDRPLTYHNAQRWL